ncbi:hypothetical protein [Spirilliplanes yamanashiensis]|uniref:Uncharacterized protein n=1 Tax=Spirilliplanes yamanashiensis TaxID=42233 RepID=A0A8J4DMZ4_9ACTN|nr:hypothetical protein [Spirilliplanes yamanashiensis]MDP9818288.1 hypothetical protein [Spirilliplanes yamanashiensis]GIJ06705.1 hypothetical protein Sya03_60570 [Spirilliplanes yamanashiensis]
MDAVGGELGGRDVVPPVAGDDAVGEQVSDEVLQVPRGVRDVIASMEGCSHVGRALAAPDAGVRRQDGSDPPPRPAVSPWPATMSATASSVVSRTERRCSSTVSFQSLGSHDRGTA